MSVEEDTRGSLSACRVYCAVDRERREKKNGRVPTPHGRDARSPVSSGRRGCIMKMGTGTGGDCPPSVPEPVPIFQASVTAESRKPFSPARPDWAGRT